MIGSFCCRLHLANVYSQLNSIASEHYIAGIQGNSYTNLCNVESAKLEERPKWGMDVSKSNLGMKFILPWFEKHPLGAFLYM